jgi:two-component system, response regulator / RNA-binding antiterminator
MHPAAPVIHSLNAPHAQTLRIVVVAPESLTPDIADAHATQEAERSRQLRIGLLENGYNLIAVLPADSFLEQRLAQLQPDMDRGRRKRCA